MSAIYSLTARRETVLQVGAFEIAFRGLYGYAIVTSKRCWAGPIFVSSRRRHTSWNCDWSSDVCSSELVLKISASRSGTALPRAPRHRNRRRACWTRSEERRVGKECKSRGEPEH